MKQWPIYIIAAAALVTAIGVLWAKLIRPLAKLITITSEVLPLLETLTQTFKEHPDAFNVLADIAAEFRTNNGSSLKDAVDRIEVAASEARAVAQNAKLAADDLKIGVEARRLLAEQDRKDMQELFLKLDRMAVAASVVAVDLNDSHKRAEEASSEHGAAADAAAKLPSA